MLLQCHVCNMMTCPHYSRKLKCEQVENLIKTYNKIEK